MAETERYDQVVTCNYRILRLVVLLAVIFPFFLYAGFFEGKVVKVWEADVYRYGRIVGSVFVGDKNLNKELLSADMAWHYKKYSRDPELAKLEFEARSAKRGLWQELDPVAPWEWRRGKRSA